MKVLFNSRLMTKSLALGVSQQGATAFVAMVSALGVISGCGKDDGDSKGGSDAAPVAPFLKASDFEGATLKEVSADDLKSLSSNPVNDLDSLQLNEEDSADSNEPAEEGSESESLSKCFGSLKFSVSDKSTVTLSGNLLDSACLSGATSEAPATGNGLSFKFDKFQIKMFLQMACEGADFSAFNGKSFDQSDELEMLSKEACANSSRMTLISNIVSEVDATVTFGGTVSRTSSVTKSAQMKADGTPCVKTKSGDLWVWEDGCTFYDSDLTLANDSKPDEANTAMVSKVIFTGVKESTAEKAKYYSEGKATIFLNGWEGEATFTGTDAAPTWVLKKGAESVTGTFDGK